MAAAGGWDAPVALEQALWTDATGRAIRAAVRDRAQALPEVVCGQRKGFTAWSRAFQFAALRPVKGGARLGLALPPDGDPRLAPSAREAWSERLTAVAVLTGLADVDDTLAALLQAAWARS